MEGLGVPEAFRWTCCCICCIEVFVQFEDFEVVMSANDAESKTV